MKRFKRLDELRGRCRRAYERRRCEKYCDLILAGRIRIWDVPEKWRRNLDTALSLYITAFRVARGTSLERFEEELRKLDFELLLLEAGDPPDSKLINRLRKLHDDKSAELEHRKRRDVYENAIRKTLQRQTHGV